MSAPRISKLLKLNAQMKNLTRLDRVVIRDYYHMTTMDENMNWMKPTHLLAISSLNLRRPLLYMYFFFSKFLIAVSNIHTRENNMPLIILCMVMPPKIPLSTLMLVRIWFEESTLPEITHTYQCPQNNQHIQNSQCETMHRSSVTTVG